MICLQALVFVVVSGMCTNSASGQVNVTYLKSVQRLSQSSHTDYYISCNAIGQYIQWQHNGEPLTVLGAGHAGHVVVSARSGFEYTATLLSSQPYNQNAMLDSILVISTVDWHAEAFEVTCNSNSGSRQITVTKRNDKIENSDSDTEIRMDYVLSNAEAVQNKNRTYIFVCGAENEQLILKIDSFQFLFNERDTVGDDRTILSEDGNTVDSQSVLIARQHPFNSTSIIFIAEDADVVVTCRFGSRRVQLFSNNRTTTSTTEPGSDDTSLSTTSSPLVAPVPTALTIPLVTTPSEKNTPDPGPTSAKTTIQVTSIICGVLLLFGALVIVMALCCYTYFYFKKKTGSKDFPRNIENGERKCKEPVQDNNSCMPQLVNCIGTVIPNKAHATIVPAEINSEESSSQENYSDGSTSEDSISDESGIASASCTTPAEDTIQKNGLHTDLQSGASQNTLEETTNETAANEYIEIKPKETPPKQIDEQRKDLGSSIHQECEEMKDLVNYFAQAKQPELVGEQENSYQFGEYAQESEDAAENPKMCPVYISSSPMKNSLKKKYILLWPTDKISSVSGSVVAGDLLKEVVILEKTDPLRGHKKGISSLVYSGIKGVAQEPLDISIEKDTTTSDEHETYEETSADLAFGVCAALLMVTVPLFSFWNAFIAGISEVTWKLERIAKNIIEVAGIILLVGGTETYIWVSVDLFRRLHFIGSKFLEVQLSMGLYMSPMSSTSSRWGRATSSAAKLQESAVATEGYKDAAANSFFRLFTFG